LKATFLQGIKIASYSGRVSHARLDAANPEKYRYIMRDSIGCTTYAALTLKLKRVALWAAGLSSRILFEWVWNGTELWVVQADLAPSRLGVNPTTLRPAEIATISPQSLQLFRVADKADFEKYGKLRNARTYGKLGYNMPVFYVLDDIQIIQQVLHGEVSNSTKRDLDELTQRPLIIRTDGIGIPKEKREMLPRSEGLPTTTQAKQWLIGKFSKDVETLGIGELPLCLIAHHFIPSIAAAWARAEPGGSVVRIESLWGLPEGLYWHSHDTFEVDVTNEYPPHKRLRFKGTFIAPDDSGRWVHHRASAPFDWGRSIAKEEWLVEIAKTTKLVAEHDKHPVVVMWFVDNDPRATPHRVLPWYHTESTIGAPKAAPRRKLTMASDFKIETTAHWEELKLLVQYGKKIERVMLEPKDPELVRNRDFARQLAEFSAAHKIVIELAGGILSHAYYILQRHGAQVECLDLFGTDEENIEYNKLVRDKIPDVIKRRGEGVEIVRLKGEALLVALRQKLVKESFEALDAKTGEELLSELADVQEVIKSICASLQVPPQQIDAEQEEKRKRRGGFDRGIILKNTSTPHSLAWKPPEADYLSLPTGGGNDTALIEYAREIPTNRPYSRPDLRNVHQRPEALLSFETELNRIGTAEQSTVFDIPIDADETRSFKISVELIRDRSSLWSQVRLRLEPSQIPMNLRSESQLELKFPKDRDSDEQSGIGE
jgi:predicted house-cleaning noncanonical NTP pyrophosphatase (MazG superfamily)